MNIFKRWFSSTKEQDVDDCNNPWVGLASYEDPEKTDRPLKFCGRDDESYDLAQLIMSNVFVTLYGKSGIGKTSLLNAGVFPELRGEHYTPMSIRLGMRDEEQPQSYQTMIIEAIERTTKRVETINIISEQADQQSIDYLWNYFARHRFYGRDNELTTPVIVFDQFEEVFRGHRGEAEILLRQLDYFIDKDHTLGSLEFGGQTYRYEQNSRFVVSIREDDLYRLEDSIDNCYLPVLKRSRYRLRTLSEEGAFDAILIPGERLFHANDKDSIAKAIINKSRNEDGSISTNIISLLCNRIYIDFKRSDANYISPALVDDFIKGNPFERFYNEATQSLSNNEKSYIEEHLVDSTSRRNSIPESDFLLHVKNGTKLLEGRNRILQRTSTSSDGKNYRIELIHDSFCEPLVGLKEKREKRKRLLLLASIAAIILLGILIMSLIGYLIVTNLGQKDKLTLKDKELLAKAQSLKVKNDSLSEAVSLLDREKTVSDSISYELSLSLAKEKEANEEKNRAISLLEQKYKELEIEKQRVLDAQWQIKDYESQVLSTKANNLIEENPELACKVALEALPKDVSDLSRPVTPEAEFLLRMAMRNMPIRTLKGHKGYVYSASFSHDGKYVVTGSRDSTAIIWNAETGDSIRTLKGHKGYVYSASFSHDGKYVVTGSRDSTAIIWNAETGDSIRTLKGHKHVVIPASFSPDGKYVVTGSADSTAIIWNAKTVDSIRTLKGHKYYVLSASFSPDGKYVVTGSRDSTAIIWNAETGDSIRTLRGHKHVVIPASFSPDGKYVVTGSRDKTAIIWNAETGDSVRTLKGHKNDVNSASFSPDGKYVVTGSDDKTAIIWDAETGDPVRTLRGRESDVNSASFSPDGKYVVTSASYSADIWRWDDRNDLYYASDVQMNPVSEKLLITNMETQPNITQTSLDGGDDWNYVPFANTPILAKDGKHLLASLNSCGLVVEWDVSSGNILRFLNGFGHGGVFSVSPDGSQIVSANQSTIKLMDIESERSKVFKECDGIINDIYFSPDGKKIAAQIDSSTVIWNAKDGAEQVRIPCSDVKFSPDNQFVASSFKFNNKLTIWNAITGTREWQVEDDDNTSVLSFSPNGQFLLASYSNGSDKDSICGVKVWDIKRKKITKTLPYKDRWQSVIASYSPQGDKMAVGTMNEGNGIHIWDTKTWECTDTIMPGKTTGIFGVAFSSDGQKLIVNNDRGNLNMNIWIVDLEERAGKVYEIPKYRKASYSHDGSLFVSSGSDFADIWNAETGIPVRILKGHSRFVTSAAFSPDDKFVVTGSYDKTAIIWDAETGDSIRTLKGHKANVNSASFSPDGKYVVTGSDDETAIIWDAETGHSIRTLKGNRGGVISASFSPDGKYLVTVGGYGDRNAIIWNAETWNPIRTLEGDEYDVLSASFSPDGKYVVIGSDSGTITILDVNGYRPVQTFKTNYANHAFFSPDGRSVIGWGKFGVCKWEFLPLPKLIGKARKLLGD